MASPSSVWAALKAIYGDTIAVWEPETFIEELTRRRVEWSPSLAAKVLGAQTVVTTGEWAFDHDVLFRFCLACDNIPSDHELPAHPDPFQLAWGVNELAVLRGKTPDDDEGFDPDTVDPAIAVILHDDGWVLCPKDLSFAQLMLDRMDKSGSDIKGRVERAWAKVTDVNRVSTSGDEAVDVQLTHLADAAREVAARAKLRSEHLAGLHLNE